MSVTPIFVWTIDGIERLKKSLTHNQTIFCARNFRQQQSMKKPASYKHPMMTMNSGVNHPNARSFTLSVLSGTSLRIQGNSSIKGFLRYALQTMSIFSIQCLAVKEIS